MTYKELKLLKVKARMTGQMITLDDPRVQAMLEEKKHMEFFDNRWHGGPCGIKRKSTEVLSTGMWHGKRCFVIAGGPSLSGFDFSQLENELTIGVNRVYEKLDCTILFAMDGRFYKWITENRYGKEAHKKFKRFQGCKFWLDISNLNLNNVFYEKAIGRTGMSFRLEDGLYHGNNSGFGALNLAVALGANPIYLLGFDMKFTEGKGHYHDGHPTAFKEAMMKSFPKAFEKTADDTKAHGVKIINLNHNSALKCYPFGDLPKNTGKKRRPIFVSFFTANGYQNVVKDLKDDMIRHSLRCDIELVQGRGAWVKNTQIKPEFLKRMLDKYPGNPIVWVDADARIREYPKLFDNFKADIGIHYRSKSRRGVYAKELLSGTIYLANNRKTRQLLDMWIAENLKCPTAWDQRTLSSVIKGWDGVVQEIPPTYCQIFDTMKGEGGEPVIEHFQASRKLRR
jgi:hypothetical protein